MARFLPPLRQLCARFYRLERHFCFVELAATVLVTFFLLRLLSLLAAVAGVFWRRWWCSFPQVPLLHDLP